jgi:DNA polymerase-1
MNLLKILTINITTPEDTEHSIKSFRNLGLKLLLQNLLKQTSVCFDTETTGLDALHAELVGISFSYEKGKGFFALSENRKRKSTIEKVYSFFENEEIEKLDRI